MADATHSSPAAVELQIRRDLAAAYRLVAHFGWDDLIATHISARLPVPGEVFLINPFGMLFEEVTASSLVKINAEGEMLEPSNYTANQAGFVIHSAVHQVRPDAGCVMHLHTRDGVAVSALEQGLLPLNQTALTVYGDIATHEYEGVALELDERARLQEDLGDSHLMLLRNHGTLALGRTVAEAFARMYFLEWACTVQVRTLGMGGEIHLPPEAAIAKVAEQTAPEALGKFADQLLWPALLRKLDRIAPDYRE